MRKTSIIIQNPEQYCHDFIVTNTLFHHIDQTNVFHYQIDKKGNIFYKLDILETNEILSVPSIDNVTEICFEGHQTKDHRGWVAGRLRFVKSKLMKIKFVKVCNHNDGFSVLPHQKIALLSPDEIILDKQTAMIHIRNICASDSILILHKLTDPTVNFHCFVYKNELYINYWPDKTVIMHTNRIILWEITKKNTIVPHLFTFFLKNSRIYFHHNSTFLYCIPVW